jgi:hypothetical protein
MMGIRSAALHGYGRAAVFAVAAGLAACASPEAKAPGAGAETFGSALARLSCPYSVTEASAWVNMMPGPGRGGRSLVVSVRLGEATASTILLKTPATTPEKLVLEIRSTEAAPIPGQVAYRETAPNPLYREIILKCRGGEIHAIRAIERVS